MRRKFEMFMVICLLATSFFLARRGAALVQSQKANQSTLCVVIDAGHGGNDPGKVGVDNVLEKDVNLAIALKLKPLFENKNIQVVLTRDNDSTMASSAATNKKVEDMQKRVKLIADSDAALTISIHQNSYPDASVAGPQVFYYSQSATGKELAETIQQSLNSELSPASPRSIKSNDNYYMLKKTPTPTIIVECGFLSNPDESKRLVDDSYQNQLARAIYLGAANYLKDKNLLSDDTDSSEALPSTQ